MGPHSRSSRSGSKQTEEACQSDCHTPAVRLRECDSLFYYRAFHHLPECYPAGNATPTIDLMELGLPDLPDGSGGRVPDLHAP